MKSDKLHISFYKQPIKQSCLFTLHCQYSYSGQQFDLGSTGVTFWGNEWDGNLISAVDPESVLKNRKLDNLRINLQAALNLLLSLKVTYITELKIRRAYLSQCLTLSSYEVKSSNDYRHSALLTAFDLYLNEQHQNTLTDQWKFKTMQCLKKHLHSFLRRGQDETILVKDFNLKQVQAFRNFLQESRRPDKKRGANDKRWKGVNEKRMLMYINCLANVLTWAGMEWDVLLHLSYDDPYSNYYQDTSLLTLFDLYLNERKKINTCDLVRYQQFRNSLHDFLASQKRENILGEDFSPTWEKLYCD